MQTKKYDLIIIGGGQAGLAAAYYAQRDNLNYLVLEAHEVVGQSWRDRYDSLTLFTPRAYSELPGMPLLGDPTGYPTKDEVSDYLDEYVRQFGLNVVTGEKVVSVTKSAVGYRTDTAKAVHESKAVIVATGSFQVAREPDWRRMLTVKQLHSADYRNPRQLPGKKVLVVGGGNSGAQIAEEIAAKHKVTMAVMGSMRFVPATIMGRSLFWWLDVFGLLNASTGSFGGRLLRKRGDPIIGTNLKRLVAQRKVRIKPGAVGGVGKTVTFADGTMEDFDAVIWCTGYTLEYSWLQVPGVLDKKSQPIQQAGVAPVPGVYFLGLGWQRSRNSALLGGVGRDALYVLGKYSHGSDS